MSLFIGTVIAKFQEDRPSRCSRLFWTYTTTTTNIAYMRIETLIYRFCAQGTSKRTFTMKTEHGCCNVNIFPPQIVKVHTRYIVHTQISCEKGWSKLCVAFPGLLNLRGKRVATTDPGAAAEDWWGWGKACLSQRTVP